MAVGGQISSSEFENRMLTVASVVAMLRIRLRAESHSEEVRTSPVRSKRSAEMSQPRASPSERCSRGGEAGRSEKGWQEGQVENLESGLYHGWGGVDGGAQRLEQTGGGSHHIP